MFNPVTVLKGQHIMFTLTHEEYIHEVAKLGIARLNDEQAITAARAKLTYGAGKRGLRGVTYFNQWLHSDEEQHAFVEICSFGEESPVQVAGTTLHELGHVIAGHKAGHGKDWHAACEALGLRRIKAAGTHYQLAMFEPSIRFQISDLITRLESSRPANSHNALGMFTGLMGNVKPCSMGIGTRGGKSRGTGSGSRLRKYVCGCNQIIRASTDTLNATHNECNTAFALA